MPKIIINFVVGMLTCIVFSCQGNNNRYKIDAETLKDAAWEHIIDSFNSIINVDCVNAFQNDIPVLAEKTAASDTTVLADYFKNKKRHVSSIEKIQKVITALQDECDSSLLKETYKKVLLLQKQKQKPTTR